MMDDLFNSELGTRNSKPQPVTCLGIEFPSDEARRGHFTNLLRDRLRDPEFRKIEGFPQGTDEAILAMSDPPYYTACPNPWLAEFVAHVGTPYDPAVKYSREPLAIDVRVGKTDQIYRAHSYHTKVPHLAIVPSILHYTQPGDVVLDGFAGSGMTGVAAQWCGTAPASYRHELEQAWEKEGRAAPAWGARRAVLNDLSPAATFIAANYNIPFDVDAFAKAGKQLLKAVEQDIGWMYETLHSDGKTKGRIEYTVWSEVFSCPECAGEVNFLAEALDEETKRVKDEFPCPHCNAGLTKKKLERLYVSRLDSATNNTLQVPKRVPSLISYRIGKTKYEKKPDAVDLALLQKIDALPLPGTVPTTRMMHAPLDQDSWGDKWRAGTASFTHVHHLYLPRAAQAMGALWAKAQAHPDARIRGFLTFTVEQAIWGLSILNRYGPTHFSQVNRQLTGVYYVASQHAECSPWYNLGGKLDRLIKAFGNFKINAGGAAINTGTAANLSLADSSIDYIFTDPPFGENLAYSELNFLVEAFHGVFTQQEPEAIVSNTQSKDLLSYHDLMRQCFQEYHRVLKPGRWMTVVFSNTSAAVWNGIQTAIQQSGFVIANVSALNKVQGSFNAVTNTTSVKQDLVISAYKPNGGFEERFQKEAQTEEGVWDFVRTHLGYLPVTKQQNDMLQFVSERDSRILFDQMIAYYVRKGYPVPISSQEFQVGLAQRFSERDGMYFLADQVAEYDRKKMTSGAPQQLSMFVSDEASAIQWLRQLIREKPQTFSDINPQFMPQLGGWSKNEAQLDLRELLNQNFLCYDGKGPVPNQIHAYLSSNWKELRNLPKDEPALVAKARDRWYVPDPNKAGDLEKLREKALLKEFEEYLQRKTKFKRNEVFRLEAIRAGFKKAWQEHDYDAIIAVADKIPNKILEEDPKLLMWYDQAVTRKGGE